MYAVIRTGGKQHRVAKGERVRVEKLSGAVGDTLKFDEVLLVGEGKEVKIGRPQVPSAAITAVIRAQGRGPKIRAFKKNKRKGFHKTVGHRQPYTEVEITGIEA